MKQAKDTEIYIIKKTISVVSKKGVDAASIKDISKACKMSPGSIYYHFENKRDLVYRSMYYVAVLIGAGIINAIDAADSIENKYKATIKSVINFTKQSTCEALFYINVVVMPYFPLTDDENKDILSKCPMYKLFSEGIEKGIIKNIPGGMRVLGYFPAYMYSIENLDSSEEQDDYFIDAMWKAIAK